MRVAIRIIGRVDDEPTQFDGKFVKAYDPTYRLPDGSYDGGILEVTSEPSEALSFLTMEEAAKKWAQSYGIRPWDGKPNRPLTAFHCSIERV